jgi:hypothetical protein
LRLLFGVGLLDLEDATVRCSSSGGLTLLEIGFSLGLLLAGPGENSGTLLDDLEEADVVVTGLLIDPLPHLDGLH